jgi:hypothetical protein
VYSEEDAMMNRAWNATSAASRFDPRHTERARLAGEQFQWTLGKIMFETTFTAVGFSPSLIGGSGIARSGAAASRAGRGAQGARGAGFLARSQAYWRWFYGGGAETIYGGRAAGGAPKLVHLTSPEARAAIGRSQQIVGRGGIYAVPERIAGRSTLEKVLRTGLPPSRTKAPVPIPQAAVSNFKRPFPPIGPVSGWKYLGQQYIAPPGTISTASGQFTATGSWLGAMAPTYAIDIVADALIAGIVGSTVYALWPRQS